VALRQRVISGVSLAAALVGLVLLDAWLSARPQPLTGTAGAAVARWLSNGLISTLIVLVLSMLAAREVTGFVRRAGYQPNRFVVQVFAAGFVIGPYVLFNLQRAADWRGESWGMLWISLALGVALLSQAALHRTRNAMLNVAAAVFIVLYIGGLAGYMTRLRMEIGGYQGATILLFSMFLVKINDVGAYLTGSLLGKHKLILWLSPGKTWEGFVGGIVVTIGGALGIGSRLYHAGVFTLPHGSCAYPWGLLWFGLLMAIFSVAGDLAASLLKRDAAVKDSGAVIPGMGGVLDILDSTLLAAPVAWFFWTRLV
jgi:phosphatidate cytidylyltransferase